MKTIIATTQKHFFDAVQIRGRVFVDEQHVPSCIEVDDEDKTCLHVLLYEEDKALAVCRLLDHGDYYKVGRMAVLKENRGKGYGKALMLSLETLDVMKGKKELRLDAQMTAAGFYGALGYSFEGEPFIEADMLHVHAIKKLHTN